MNPKTKKIQYLFRNGRTILILASQNGHLEVVQYLIDKGANIESKDNSKSSYSHEHGNNSFDIAKTDEIRTYIKNYQHK